MSGSFFLFNFLSSCNYYLHNPFIKDSYEFRNNAVPPTVTPTLSFTSSPTPTPTGTWLELGNSSASDGGISNDTNLSSFPSIAVDNNGYPVIAWFNSDGNDNEIYVKHWDGANWVAYGTSASGGGISNNNTNSYFPVLCMANDGRVTIVWEDSDGNDTEIYFKCFIP